VEPEPVLGQYSFILSVTFISSRIMAVAQVFFVLKSVIL
jgi:hypothetical protein